MATWRGFTRSGEKTNKSRTHPRLVNEGVEVDQLLCHINLVLDLDTKECQHSVCRDQLYVITKVAHLDNTNVVVDLMKHIVSLKNTACGHKRHNCKEADLIQS